MIRPEIITRDDSKGLTYFIAELQEGKTYALFSLFDDEAAQNMPAKMEFVGESVDNILNAMKIAFKEDAKVSKAVKSDAAEAAPAKRKRIPAK